jgi:hypothetical protein
MVFGPIAIGLIFSERDGGPVVFLCQVLRAPLTVRTQQSGSQLRCGSYVGARNSPRSQPAILEDFKRIDHLL